MNTSNFHNRSNSISNRTRKFAAGRASLALAAALAVAGVLAVPTGARAGTETWVGTTGDWNTSTNWSGLAVPTNVDTAVFGNGATTSAVTFSAAGSALNLQFNQTAGPTGYTIGTTGSAFNLALSNGGYIQMLAGDTYSQTVDEPLSLGGNYLFANDSTSATTLTIGGTVSGTGTDALTLGGTNTGTQTISGVISNGTGTVSVNVNTSGTWKLSGTNTFTGGTTISGGTLAITGDSAIDTGGIAFSGGTLQFDNYNSGLNFASEPVQLGAATGIASTLAGAITGTSSLTYQGPGTLTLTGANTYSGGTTINAGTLAIGSDAELGIGGVTFGGGTLQFDNYSSTLAFISEPVKVGAATGGASTLSGAITGTSSLTYQGPGTLILTGANTYTGGTTFNAGTLAIGSDAELGTGGGLTFNGGSLKTTTGLSDSRAVVLNAGGGTIDAAGNADTFSGQFTGGGALTVESSVGTGSVTLTNSTNSYTGLTTVDGNTTLFLTGAGTIADSSAVYLAANGATFDISGTSGTSIKSLGAGYVYNSTVNLGANTLTITNGLTGTDGTFGGVITGTGNLTISGGTETLDGANTYTGGTTINSGATLALTGIGVIADSSYLNIAGGTFDISGVSPGSATANNMFGNSSGLVKLGTKTLNVTGNSDNTFAGVISGGVSSGLSVSVGSGTYLALSGANTYFGATTINTGTLALTNGGSILNSNGVSVATGSFFDISKTTAGATVAGLTGGGIVDLGSKTLTVNIASGNDSFAGTIQDGGLSGAILGQLTKTGSGTLTLTGANTYTGATTINAGLLVISADDNLGNSGSGGVTFGGGTLQLNNYASSLGFANQPVQLGATGTATLGGNITGTSGLTYVGPGTLNLTGANNYSGTTTVSGGTLEFTSGTSSLSGNVTDNANLIFNQGTSSSLSGNISGSGSLTQQGSATLTLGGTESYLGGTTISSGALEFTGSVSGLGGGITDNSSLIFGESGNNTISIAISGTGTVTQQGSGTLILSGANSYHGATIISNGTLEFIGSAGGLIGPITDNSALVFNQSANDNVLVAISGTGSVTQEGSAILTLSAAEGYSGGTTVSSGTLNLTGSLTPTGGLTVNGGTFEINNGAGQTVTTLNGTGGTVNLNLAADNLTVSNGGTFSGGITGNAGLTVTGNTLILSGTNTYTGGTTINSGAILSVTGSIAGAVADAGTFNVSSSLSTIASLTGVGTTNIGGGDTLTINPASADSFGGTLAGAGGLTVNGVGGGSLFLSGTSTLTGYTGLTTIENGGTLKIALLSGLHSGDAFAYSNAGTLDLIGTGSQTLGTVALGGADVIDGGGATNTITLGNITGGGVGNALTTQDGNFIFSGTVSGPMTVNGDTVTINSANALVGYSGPTAIENSGTLNIAYGAALPNGTAFNFSNSGNLNFTGSSTTQTIGTVALGGTDVIDAGGVANDFGIAGNITGGVGDNLTLQNGTFTLSGAGNHTSFTTGTLELGNGGLDTSTVVKFASTNALPGASATILLNGATLQASVTGQTISSLITVGDAPTTNIITASGGTLAISNTITDTDGSTLILEDGTLNLSGLATSSNFTTGVMQIGDGADATVANFAGNGSVPGTGSTLVLNDGTFQFGANGMNVSTLTTVDTLGGTIDIAGHTGDNYSGAISGTGALTVENSVASNGTLILSGNNSGLVGGVNVGSSGLTLNFTNINSFGSGTVALNNTADTLQFNGVGLAIANALDLASTGATLDLNSNSGTWSGQISGADLTIKGGTLTLSNNANNYTGGTTINSGATLDVTGAIIDAVANAGTFDVNNSFAITSLTGVGTTNIGGGDTLTINPTSADALAGSINGNGALTLGGTAALTLSGTNGYLGGTTINSGAVLTVTGSIAGAVADAGTFNVQNSFGIANLTGNGSVAISPSDNLTVAPTNNTDTFGGVISGATGALTVAGGAGTSLTLSNTNTYGGGTTINAASTLTVTGSIAGAVADAGTFNANNTLGITNLTGNGTVAIANGQTLTVSPTSNTDTFSGNITGTGGSLIVSGGNANSLTLLGTNTFTGGTTIGTGGTGATLILGAGASLASGSNLTFDTSGTDTFELASGLTQNIGVLNGGSNTSATIDIASGTLVVADGVNFAGSITGNGGLVVNGGTLNLSGSSTFSGGATLQNGSITVVGSNTALGSGQVDIGTGGATIRFGGVGGWNVTNTMNILASNTGTLDANGLSDTWSGTINDTGSLAVINSNATPGFVILTNAETYSGGTNIGSTGTGDVTLELATGGSLNSSGNLTVGSLGTLEVNNGSGQEVAALNGSGTITLSAVADNLTVSNGGTFSGGIGGSGGLILDGGTLTLSGTNGYTGGTTVNGGTLQVTGSVTGGGNLSIFSPGTFTLNTAGGTTINTLSGNGLLELTAGTLTVNGGGTFTGAIDGSGGLTVHGSTLSLLGTGGLSGYTGLTTIENGGILNIKYAESLPGTDAFAFNTNGTLNFIDPNSQTIGNVTVSGTDTIDAGGVGNVLTIAGTITSGSSGNTLILQNGTIVLGNTGNSGTFTAGTLQLGNGALPTIVQFNNAGELPASAVTIDLATATLAYTNTTAVTVANNFLVAGSGNILTDNGLGTGNVFKLTGDMHGSVTGNLQLTDGTFELAPASGNNSGFVGTLDLNNTAGAVVALVDSNNALTGGVVEFDGGTLQANAGGLAVTNNFTVNSAGGTFNDNGNGTTGTPTQLNGAITGTGQFTILGNSQSADFVTLGNAGNNPGGFTFQTVTVNAGAAGDLGTNGLTFNNAKLDLTAAVTFNNTINLIAGTTDIIDGGGFTTDTIGGSIISNSGAGAVLRLQNGTFDLTGTNNGIGDFTVGELNIGNGNGGLTGTIAKFTNEHNLPAASVNIALDAGTLQYAGNGITVLNNVIVKNNGGALDINGNTGETYAGALQSTGPLTLENSSATGGTLTLTGNNSGFSGSTTIDSGLTVNFQNTVSSTSNFGTGQIDLAVAGDVLQYGANGINLGNAVAVSAGSSIDINNRTGSIYSGSLSGGSALTLENTAGSGGTLILTGNNSAFSGTVAIDNGLTINFQNTASSTSNFGSSVITLNTGNDTLQFGAANITVSNALVLASTGSVMDVDGHVGTWSGGISGVGEALAVDNSSATAGELILTNANSYSGGTTIDDGSSAGQITLALENGGSLSTTGNIAIGKNGELLLAHTSAFSQTIGSLNSGAITSNVTLDTNNTLQVNDGGSFAGSLNGTGGLTVDGTLSAPLVLTGNLAGYAGLTTIQNNGTLNVSAASGLTAANTLAFTFGAGNTTAATLDLGPSQTIGVLTLGGTDIVDGGGATASTPVTLGGQIVGSGTDALTLQNGHFDITNFNNGTAFSGGTLSIGDGSGATVAQFLASANGSHNALPATAVGITLDDGTFQFGGPSINVTNAIGVAAASSIDVNGQTGAEISGVITIATGLTLENTALGGGGTLTLAAANSGTGGITIDNGLTVNVQNSGAFAAASGTVVLNAAGDTLQFGADNITMGLLTQTFQLNAASLMDVNGKSGSTFAGDLSGASSLTLENSNTGTGNNKLSLSGASGSFSGNVTINNGLTVNFAQANAFGTGLITLNAAGDTLQYGANGITLGNNIAVIANSNIDIDGTTGSTYTGNLTGGANLTLENSNAGAGSNILTFTGNNDSNFTGNTTIQNGMTVDFNTGTVFGTGSVTLAAANDQLQFGAGVSVGNTLNLGSTGGTIDVDGQNGTWAGVIQNAGSNPEALAVVNSGGGPGTLTLTGTNTWSGGTTIGAATGQDVTLAVSGTGTVGSGLLTINATGEFNMNAGTVNQTVAGLVGSGTVAVGNNTLILDLPSGASDTFSGGINSFVVSPGGLTVEGAGTETLTGTTNTYLGATNISGNATLALSGTGNISGSSSVNLNSSGAVFDISATTGGTSIKSLGGVAGSNVTLGSQTLTITNASGTFGGAINGTGALALTGGTETLTGTNTFTGGTTISGGGALILGTGGSLAQGSNLTFASDGHADTFELNSGLTQNIGILNGGGNASAIIDIATGSTLVVADGVNFDGAINGLGGLVVNGGTLNLNGNSTFSGGSLLDNASTTVVGSNTALGAGQVTIGTGGATIQFGGVGGWTLANTVVISGTNTLAFDSNGLSDTWSGAIGGTGSLDVINSSGSAAGTLILTNANNNYTGGTTIGAATGQIVTLDVSGIGTIGSGLLTINATGRFDMTTGTVGQTIAGLSGSGDINVGANTLTLNLPNGASDVFGGVISSTTNAGGLTVEGSGTQTLTGTNTYTGPTIINGNATLALSGSNDVIATSSGVDLATAGATFNLSGTTATQNIGSLNGVTGTSIVLSTTTAQLQINDGGIFSGSISGSHGGLIVDGTNDLALTLNGSLSNYTALTTIQNSGTLNIKYADNLPATDAFTFINSGTLNFTDPSSQTIGNVVVGGTDVIDAGGAGNVLTIAGTITSFNPGNLLILQNGTIDVNGANTGTFTQGTLQIGNGSGNITSALVNVNSSAALPLTAVGITLDDGTFQYGTGGMNVTNPVAVNAAGAIDIAGTSGSQVSGNISGTANLLLENSNTTTGDNKLILSGDNGANGGNYTGDVTIDSGMTVNFRNTALADNTLGTGNFGTGSITLAAAGDTLQFGADGINLGNAIAINANSNIDIDGTSGSQVSGVLSGAANLTLENSNVGTGSNILIISGPNTYTGNTTVDNGMTVNFTQSSAFGSGGTVILAAANDKLQLGAGSLAVANNLELNSTGGTIDTNGETGTQAGTWSGVISGNDLTVNNSSATTAGQLTLTNTNTYTGGTTIGAATDTQSTTLAVTGIGTISSGLLTLANPGNTSTVVETFDMSGGTVNQSVAGLVSTNTLASVKLGSNTLTLILPTATNDTFAGAISGVGGNLTIKGAGTETLSGANTYTGNTTVNAGAALVVTGSLYGGTARGNLIANGDVTFNNGLTTIIDTLSGTGTLDLENVGANITTLEVTGTTSGTGAGASSTFGGTLLGNGNLEAFNSTLDLTGNISGFTGSLTANTTGNIVVSSAGQLDSLASLNVTNDHSITLAYGNLNGNAVNFNGNLTSNPSGILFVTGNHASANLGSLTNAITISDSGNGVVTTNIIDAGGITNTLTLAGALTSDNTGTGGSNTLQLENGNFVLANTNNITDFKGKGNLQIGDGADATIAQFSSANNLPNAGVGLTLDLGELAYTGSGAATVSNNITDSASTNNLIDAGAQTLTLAGSITNTIGTLTLQNGTFVLGGTNGASVNPTFSGGTLELGNGGSDTSTIADFASENNLPGSGANILLNGASLVYTGGATNPVIVANAITIGDAPTTNIMDAGGASETLNGLLTDADGSTLILQDGTIVLGDANNASVGGFTSGTLQIGNTGVTTSIAQFAVAGDLPAAGVDISFDNGELQYQGAAATAVTVSNNLSLIANGIVDGGGNAGLVTLAGELINTNAANTLTVQNGTFALTNVGDTANNNTTFTAGTLAIGNGTGTTASAVVKYGQASSLPGINAAILLNDGTLAYTGTGSSAVVNAIELTGTGNGVVDAGAQTLTLSGAITDNSNTLTLQNGHLILSNANNSTDFVGGSLQIGNGSLATTVSSASASYLPSGTVGDVVGITLDDGTFQQTASYTVANNLSLEKNALAAGTNVDTLDVDGNTGTYTGIISDSGAGTLATLDLNSSVAGSGTVILDGVNTYSGATNVLNGVTAVAGGQVAGSSNAFGAGATTDLLTVSGTGSTVDSINAYNLTQHSLLASATGEAIQVGAYTQDVGTNLNLVAFGRPVTGQPTSGTYDSLNANTGSVKLAGTLNLAFSSVSNAAFTHPADFDTYNVITTTSTANTGVTASGGASPTAVGATPVETSAGVGGNTYGIGWLSVNPGSTNPNYNPDLNYYENSPTGNSGNQTVAIQTLFLPDAQTPNEQAIARYIDQNVTPFNNVPPAIQTALANLSLLTRAQIVQVLNGLTPQAYSGLADEAFQNSTFLNQEVFQQTQNAFQSDGFNTSGLTMLNTKNQDPFAISLESQMKSAQQQATNSMAYMDDNTAATTSDSGYANGSGFNGFVLGTITFDQQANNGSYSQKDTTGGVLAGLDYRLNRNLVVGALFNWNYTGGTLDNLNSGQQVSSYTPGLFAGYRRDNFYVDALATYTYNTYRIDRNINIPGSPSVATGEPTANQYDAGILAGYNMIASHGLKIGPAAGVGFTQMNISGFNETGSPFDMSVSKQHADSLRTLLGAQGTYALKMQNLPLPISFNFDAFWQHECLDSARGITSSFSQVSGGQFLFGTPGPARDSALLGVGASGYLAKGVSLFVNYQTQIGERSQYAQTVMAGVAVKF